MWITMGIEEIFKIILFEAGEEVFCISLKAVKRGRQQIFVVMEWFCVSTSEAIAWIYTCVKMV